MEIHGAGGAHGPQPIYPRLAEFDVQAGRSVDASATPKDSVEISPLGHMLDKIDDLPEIRHELVDRIRSELATGRYETPAKLEIALDRLIDELERS